MTASTTKQYPSRRKFKAGDKVHKLTIVCFDPESSYAAYICQCECGTIRKIPTSNLSQGLTKSCGSFKCRDKRKMWPFKRHGECNKTVEYGAWSSMKQRCLNPNSKKYNHYGGRGIKVCARWMKFENFLADMGRKPDGFLLDRIDTNGNYEPSNCRWASKSISNKNRRPWKRGPNKRNSHGND